MIKSGGSNLSVSFVELDSGKQPVEDWIENLPIGDKIKVMHDIELIQTGVITNRHPKIKDIKGVKGLREIRCNLSSKRIARLLFCVKNQTLVLLHGFIKKTNKTPKKEIAVAKSRMKGL